MKIYHSPCLKLMIMLSGIVALGSCNSKQDNKAKTMEESKESPKPGTYGYDVQFFKDNGIDVYELQKEGSPAKVLVAPGYQGRVMTSSAKGNSGASFGWINYDFITAGKTDPQFNPVGGEERIWLGPEGGPYSIYFSRGEEQVFENWNVPKFLDTTPFDVVSKKPSEITFKKDFSVTNASGFEMNVDIQRTVQMLTESQIKDVLQQTPDTALSIVAYETRNVLTNAGKEDWEDGKGFLSIWLLSMFNPSPNGTVFIPFHTGDENELGKVVTDDYFGKVPEDRLKIEDGVIFFKTDGKHRSKIGLSPQRATSYCGSYDPDKKVLTLLWFSKPDSPADYVNSKWANKDDLLKGDALNSYNDGPVEDGSIMGPFYEIESSSPAAMLKAGENIKHTQRILHISGNESKINDITTHLFNISLEDIKKAL